jgi:hypothetical protein
VTTEHRIMEDHEVPRVGDEYQFAGSEAWHRETGLLGDRTVAERRAMFAGRYPHDEALVGIRWRRIER